MKRVLFVLSALDSGGVERTVYNIVPALTEKGYGLDFVVFGEHIGILEENIKNMGHNVYHITPKRKNYFKYFCEVRELFKKNQYQIVHCHLAEKGLLFYKFAKKKKIKCIMHTHGCWNNLSALKRIKKDILVKFCLRKIDKIVSCSTNSAKYVFGSRYNISEILLNSFVTEKFCFSNENRLFVRNRLNIGERDRVVGIVARISKEKNHIFLLDVFEKVRKIYPDYKMMIIGDGPEYNAVLAKVKELNMENDVICTGACDDPSSYYSAMDCFVMPSTHEGFGMALVEAQISGLMCFVSQYITDEAIIDTDRVTKIKLEDIDGWIRCISSITLDYCRQVEMSNFDRFRSDVIASRYIAIYEGLIGC